MISNTLSLARLTSLLFLTSNCSLASAQTTTSTSTVVDESRHSYVSFPTSAIDLLRKEVNDIGSPLGFSVVTSVTKHAESMNVWEQIKGISHRLHKQNQILHVNPHFYVDHGLDVGCRDIRVNEDTGIEQEVEVLPVPPQCVNACTNHGRYCAVDEATNFVDSNTNARGSMMVEETLRRICFVQLYHGSDLKLWEYMELFDQLDCDTQDDMATCAGQAMGGLPSVNDEAIDNCMRLAGGLENDTDNVRLKEQTDKQKSPGHLYEATEVPFVKVGPRRYRGAMVASDVFAFVCATFHDDRQVLPLACEFCSSCQGVRHCLWFLDCDGTSFSEATKPASSIATALTVAPADVPPVTVPPAADTSTNSGTTGNQDTKNDGSPDIVTPEQDEVDQNLVLSHALALLGGFVLLCLYFPAVAYYKRQQEEKKNSSAEEYFNEMMHASYGDNMAISCRIDDDASDRVFEFEEDEEVRRRNSSSRATPPTDSFKVHVVKI